MTVNHNQHQIRWLEPMGPGVLKAGPRGTTRHSRSTDEMESGTRICVWLDPMFLTSTADRDLTTGLALNVLWVSDNRHGGSTVCQLPSLKVLYTRALEGESNLNDF